MPEEEKAKRDAEKAIRKQQEKEKKEEEEAQKWQAWQDLEEAQPKRRRTTKGPEV